MHTKVVPLKKKKKQVYLYPSIKKSLTSDYAPSKPPIQFLSETCSIASIVSKIFVCVI